MKKKYSTLAFFNLLWGVCAILLYLPYTLDAFEIKGFKWLREFAPEMLKENYFKVLIYFGVFLLAWIIILSVLSLATRPNLPKLLFKISAISALILPLINVLAMENEKVLEFWIKNIAEDVKMISYVFLAISLGSAFLGLMFNLSRDRKANLHLVLQAIVMCTLLALFVALNGWCGWEIKEVIKMNGILMGLFAIYLPISSIVLMLCKNKRD